MNPAHEVLAATGRHSVAPAARTGGTGSLRTHAGLQTDVGVNRGATYGITARVSLAGKFRGELRVSCDDKSAALMASKMLGIDLDKIGAEMSDGLGEVCNMIAGNFKHKIAGLGNGCMLSVPTVTRGSDCINSADDSPVLDLRLLFESMPIIISLRIEN